MLLESKEIYKALEKNVIKHNHTHVMSTHRSTHIQTQSLAEVCDIQL